MNRARSPTWADHRRADEVVDADARERALRCQARGCPRRWTVANGSSFLCTAHAGHLPADWPAITERIVWEETQAALDRARAPMQRSLLEHYPVPPTPEQLAKLKAWADERRDRPHPRRKPGPW
jgi:hypothetical protein